MYSDNRWDLVTAGRVYPKGPYVPKPSFSIFGRPSPLVKPDSYKSLNDGQALPLTHAAIEQIARKLAKRQSD